MARLKNAYLTNQGKQMMFAGGQITYTKAVLFGQDISGLTIDQLRALTSLTSPLRETQLGIKSKSSQGNTSTVGVEATFQNTGLTQNLYFNSVGYFAKLGNGPEQLIAVIIADKSAYIGACEPGDVETDAIDITLNFAFGDATAVTAQVDPAGTITPTQLNEKATQLTDQFTADLATKEDKTDAEAHHKALQDAIKAAQDQTNQALKDKADVNNVYSKSYVDQALSDKEDTSDVNAKLSKKADQTGLDALDSITAKTTDVDKALDLKADKTAVDQAIKSIDFSPYAKTADVAKELAGKEDAGFSYSKAELDKRFLELSADTGGKVSADQVLQMINGKANVSDVYTKTEVDNALALKDDTTDVDAKIKKITDSVATKANSTDVYDKTFIDNAFKQRDTAINAKANQSDLDKTNQAVAAKADASSVYTKTDVNKALASKDDTADVDSKLTKKANQTDLDNTNKTVVTKADQSDVNAKYTDAVNQAKQAQTAANNAQSSVNTLNGQAVKSVNGIKPTNGDVTDWPVKEFDSPQAAYDASKSNKYKHYICIYDMNDEASSGVIDGQKITIQWLYDVHNNLVAVVNNKANQSDLDALRQTVQQQAQTIVNLQQQITNNTNEIAYIKANYIEGKRFTAAQSADAETWEGTNSQRIAFVEK